MRTVEGVQTNNTESLWQRAHPRLTCWSQTHLSRQSLQPLPTLMPTDSASMLFTPVRKFTNCIHRPTARTFKAPNAFPWPSREEQLKGNLPWWWWGTYRIKGSSSNTRIASGLSGRLLLDTVTWWTPLFTTTRGEIQRDRLWITKSRH
jgi:hypothetical protein